jgi:hypothetical protein
MAWVPSNLLKSHTLSFELSNVKCVDEKGPNLRSLHIRNGGEIKSRPHVDFVSKNLIICATPTKGRLEKHLL